MFAQYVFLMALITPTLSEFTIHQESYERDCIDVSCPKGSFKQISQPLKKNMKNVQCTICPQCTDYGYSVCAQFRLPSLRFKREDNDGSTCNCANSVPLGCRIYDNRSREKKNPNTEIINVCYLSTLRTPPRALALNQKEVIATLEQFWLEPYWQEFELSNLTFFYEFEVKTPEDCDGNVTTNEGSENPHICTGLKEISMDNEEPSDTTVKSAPNDPTDFFAQTDDEEYEEDKDAPPELQFERNVFSGAKTVKLWYTVVVKRPRQLNLLKGEQKIQDITTLLSSETLKFDLQPEVYEKTESKDDDDSVESVDESKVDGHKKVDKVDIKEDADAEDDEEEDSEDDDTSEYKDGKESGVDYSGETTEAPSEEAETTTEEASEDEKNKTSTVETTEVTEDSDESSEETTEVPTIMDDDSAVNETATFFETHFGNWPLIRVGFVLTFVACVLIIAAGCCYKYRGCCCYSDRQKMVTKSSNGYEYHVTGQEMVGPPETEKLAQ